MLKFISKKYYIIILSFFVLLNSCMKEKTEPPKNLEQIRAEEGLPVEIKVIQKSEFKKELTFYSTIYGINEAFEPVKISDRIIKINTKIGDYVKEGQILIQFPKDNPNLQYEQAKSALDIAEKTLNRMKELLAAGEISQQNYDNTLTQYQIAKRNFESIDQLVNVRAPISGTVISLPYRVGDVPKHDTKLFTIAQTNKMLAKVKVSDSEIGYIKKGAPAYAKWNGQTFNGRVKDISLSIDPETKSFRVDVEIDNPKNVLKSGMTLDISIKTENKSDIISIERNLIIKEGNKNYVFVDNNGIAKKKEVSLGSDFGIFTEILSGLDEGDKLINCCTTFLEDGMKIKVINNK